MHATSYKSDENFFAFRSALSVADWCIRPNSVYYPSAREQKGISPELRRHRIYLEMVANVDAGNRVATSGIVFW